MGIGNIGIWQLLVVLLIVLLIFGSGKIKNLGKDLGGAFKGFKSAMTEIEETENELRKPTAEKDNTKSRQTS